MTDGEKKARTKKQLQRAWDGSKLIMVLSALTAAINGYTSLKQESMDLGKENALAFEALASKVNSMASKMAYIEGRIDGLRHSEARDAVELKIEEFDVQEEAEDMVKRVRARSVALAPLPPNAAAAAAVEGLVATVVKPDKEMASSRFMNTSLSIQIDAYEQLPEELDELMEVQEQLEEQIQEE